MEDQAPAIRIDQFQAVTSHTRPIFCSDRDEAGCRIRSRPLRVVLLQPVIELAISDLLLFAKILLRLSAPLPDLNQGKHQLLCGRVGRFHSFRFFVKTMAANSCRKYVLYRTLTQHRPRHYQTVAQYFGGHSRLINFSLSVLKIAIDTRHSPNKIQNISVLSFFTFHDYISLVFSWSNSIVLL